MLFGEAIPTLPGKVDRARRLAEELEEIAPEDLLEMFGRQWDPEYTFYGRWWLDWARDMLGADLVAGGPFRAPPEPILTWTAE